MIRPGRSVGCRLAIFDFDGTLADSWPWFAASINEAAARHGFRQVDAAERERLRGLPTREILAALAVPAWKLPRIAADLRARALRDAARIPLFPGVPALLRALARRGVTTAIASSNAERTVRVVLGDELAASIDHLDCGAALFGKAARLRRLLRRTRVNAADALVIGDELRDLEAARAAGLRCALVTWGYASAEAVRAACADHVCDSLPQLRRLLLGTG